MTSFVNMEQYHSIPWPFTVRGAETGIPVPQGTPPFVLYRTCAL